ncbi:hypothetical protein [Streptomyces sp. NPDC002676]
MSVVQVFSSQPWAVRRPGTRIDRPEAGRLGFRYRASSEREVSAACDRLVSGATVMDLQGGMVRARGSDYDEYLLHTCELLSSCTIYKVPGPGRTTNLFTLVVRGSDPSEPLNPIGDDSGLEPFYAYGTGDRADKPDVTAVADRRPEPWPVGDGTLGRYGNHFTTVRAVCGPGSSATAPKLLNVTARADYEDVPTADRQRLARIARSAAEKLTHRIGCKTRLPDRALAVPVRDANPVESCLPAVSPDQVGRITGGAAAGHTAGGWWASSLRDGKPALHTLSTSYAYDDVLGSRTLSALFRAYVADITKQRGCTHVTYPDAKDFRLT